MDTGDNMLLTSFLLVFLAEIADKTQFLMLALSQTYSFRSLFAGMSISACLLSLLSIAAAGWLHACVPLSAIRITASLLFLLFGFHSLKMQNNEQQKQRRLPFPWLSVAAAFFIAELGDKTQIAAVALAAQSNELTAVWAGSALGLICSNTIAVLIGKALFRHVRTSTLQLLSAVLFFLYGSYTLFSVYPPSQVQLVIYCLCLFTVAYFFALWQYRKNKDA